MDDQSYQRWLEQIAAYQDGSLSNEQLREFDQALQADEQKRAIFISVHEPTIGVMEVLRARFVASEESSATGSGLVPGVSFSPRRSTLLLASGIVLFLLIGFFWWAIHDDAFSGQVAEVTYEKQAVWQTASSDKSIRELTYLQPATNYMLRSGITRIKMSDGAVVSMTGPAAFTLVNGHENSSTPEKWPCDCRMNKAL
ncbi:hypothetical protein Poly59_57680 [Rubripirellula reticaptiva]|uniref:FecR protein n=2 Tax=Rubripirellula reticaptiva TaxID=2528013 RepID=A0A5C6EE77_9BACT|nr:hypothetical protein Poly59_57680 [Rubripirellula reticaptiva]